MFFNDKSALTTSFKSSLLKEQFEPILQAQKNCSLQ